MMELALEQKSPTCVSMEKKLPLQGIPSTRPASGLVRTQVDVFFNLTDINGKEMLKKMS